MLAGCRVHRDIDWDFLGQPNDVSANSTAPPEPDHPTPPAGQSAPPAPPLRSAADRRRLSRAIGSIPPRHPRLRLLEIGVARQRAGCMGVDLAEYAAIAVFLQIPDPHFVASHRPDRKDTASSACRMAGASLARRCPS